MQRHFRITLLPALFLTAAAAAAEPIDLKGPAWSQGETVTVENKVDTEQAHMTITVQGQVLQGQMEMDSENQSKIEMLEVQDGQLNKLQQTIVESKQLMKMTMFGQQEITDLGGELKGLSFIQTRTDDGWKTEVKNDNNLPREVTQELEEMQFVDPAMFYPAEPIEIGETWDLTAEQMATMMAAGGMPGAEIEGDASFKLVEVKQVDGVRTAVINYTMDIQMGMPLNQQGIVMKMNIDMIGEGTIFRSLETYSEINEMKGNMVMNMSAEQGGQQVMQMNADMPMTSTTRMTRTPGGAEDAQDAVDEEVEGAGEDVEEAGDAIQDGAEDAAEEIEE